MNPESMLKGRMAETLFEELMRQSGNIVYRFGYEAIVQNLVQLEEKFDRYNEVGERIRAIPDFIVLDKSGKPEFVEVKFRWDSKSGNADPERLVILQKYWGAKLVVVNCWQQPYFRIAESPYLDNKKQFVLNPLMEVKNWKIKQEVYWEFENLVHKYLTPTLIPSKDKKANSWSPLHLK
ncbi:MAG: hypothetical protein HY220_04440 [Candidatus Sungbacteria bacterium]|uniref:Uncharacterized protein n=1 Tax=Candidatus Sungiibacteriota bacterium TaxID=2750080 RepID=A0A9D6LP03_9BACT|nr:hypothetical protein [Candidatus Sungbacteria bacterium]